MIRSIMIMKEALAIVTNLNDVQAVSLLKQLNRNLFQAVAFNEVRDHLQTGGDDITLLKNLDIEMKKQTLNPEDSVKLTKHILMAFAQSNELSPALVQSWEEIKNDDSLFIGTIVAIGLLANLTLLLASTGIEFKVGNLKIKKTTADAGMIKEIVSPITELIKKLTLTA